MKDNRWLHLAIVMVGPLAAAAIAVCVARAANDPARPNTPTFVRAININGLELTIDGRRWEAGRGNPANYDNRDKAFENQQVTLTPPTDDARAQMIRSSTWTPTGNNRIAITGLATGTYSVFLYIWEDNFSQTFDVMLNDRVVAPQYVSGEPGAWRRLGPWVAEVTKGEITITSRGGHANMSGVEVWRGVFDQAPAPVVGATAPTPEQLNFFEQKIRPVLAERCYDCHSAKADKVKGGLMLDNRAAVLKGGDHGPAVVIGDPDVSHLIKAIRRVDPDTAMPPKKELTTAQVADFETWVKMGLPDPRSGPVIERPKFDMAKAKRHWSLQPVHATEPPEVSDPAWSTNAVDRFVYAALQQRGLTPLGEADKRTLIRRATFDLIGLPPTPVEIDAFLDDKSPEAFARVVDRLLASPRYGERWGRHWMDLVRYADTTGCNSDYPVPQLYLYRNYIIDSFNADKPYDVFLTEQIAGDLMPHDSWEQRNEHVIATGYLAGSRRFGSSFDDYPMYLTIEDTMDNLGRTVLGLTLTCARCHDHKFDPISTQDYYGIYGIFASTKYAFPGIELLKTQRDFVPLVSDAERDRLLAPFREKEAELKRRVDAIGAERKQLEQRKAELTEQIKNAPDDAAKKPLNDELSSVGDRLNKAHTEFKKAAAALEVQSKKMPELPDAYAVQDGNIHDALLQLMGNPDKTGAPVPRKFIDVLGGQRLADDVKQKTSGRLQLAGWLTDPANPLTARVMVNRIWGYHFGDALVDTPSDFGTRGEAPSHPQLLDLLAQRFVDEGWSIKAIHRVIMLTRTYRTASVGDESVIAANLKLDPDNDYHWRANHRRLDAESMRDTMLAVSGELDASMMTVAHPFPPQVSWGFTQHHPFKDVYPSKRRSVYLMTKRLTAMPYFTTFDGADRSAHTPGRDQSVTTVQALWLMNNAFIHERAEAFAARVLRERGDDNARLDYAFLLTLGRPVSEHERQAAIDYLQRVRDTLTSDGVKTDDAAAAAWRSFARALLSINEFLYVD
ncbi:MAG: DUF1553 domain-containing protein [Phycisphaera sp.]|nr:DUF1553 domain-containing protein [Phycisphaera sp.]